MYRILKWNIPVDDQPHEIGTGRVVHVACQYDEKSVQVWTEEDAEGKPYQVLAKVVGTGQPFHRNGIPVGSCIAMNGSLVWHVIVYPNDRNSYLRIHSYKL